jgi:REP-associated tyrosine transposase
VKLYKAAHTVYKTQYHIVWVTRFRRTILGEGVAKSLRVKLREVQQYYPDWHFTEIGIDKDHGHVHMGIPPKDRVSVAVETIKKNTSRALREKVQFLDKMYWDRGGIWSKGYFVSTVGITDEIIRRYVARQGKEDAGQAQLEF